MERDKRLKILINTKRTVFTLKNLADIWELKMETAKIVAKRMVDKEIIYRIVRGYYSLTPEGDIYEMANLIIQPSYISLHSALFYHNVSFQVSTFVSSVGLINYEKRVDKNAFKYYSMKKTLFFNLEGIEYKKNITIAKPERAILDSLYFGITPNLDNLNNVNYSYMEKLSFFYPYTVRNKIYKIREGF
jgi:predicted transcriptional regulator of viral defense system